ncbi:interferon gamma receptor 2 [Chelmon rostratus]|uniref:interferon gamma receptor 2 n=1 Tax=Chelmon rostratus TaxID=109905 RepID=UPI001BE627AB|nr:interferon gamma receptor 2 [Chelmon rostratus]
MFFIALCFQFVVLVLSEAPPTPPQNVHVNKWQLTWTPATEERNITYTVQYSSFDSDEWINVTACVQIPSNSCDVAVTKATDEQGCVMLRVRAERHGLNSAQVEACSTHGDSCTPEFSLTPQPGSLTVHLSRNHSLAQEYQDHAKHRVFYGKEGEPLEHYEDNVSSVSLRGLQEGQRYCTKVQYIHFSEPVGLPSCTRCVLVPESKKDSKQAEIVVSAVVVLVVVVLTPVLAYVLLFQRGRIKRWLQPPCKIPRDFLLEPIPEQCHPISPTEEHYDIISSVTVG